MTIENALPEDAETWSVTVNSFGDKFFFKLNRHSFNKVGAYALFETHFGKSLFNEDTLIVVVGTDSGLLPQYIQRKPFAKGARYIFIEPEEVLLALRQHHLLDGLDEQRMVCISLEEWSEAIHNFKIKDYFFINGVASFNAICAQDDFIQEYAEISWHITEVLSQMHWLNTVELGSEEFISRQIVNVADNIVPAKVLAQAFQAKTVVLLAGGPSLDVVLPWVQQHRHEIVVFAVSRISRQLLQAAIEPDFVFSVDPTELSFDISKEMLNFSPKTTFICSHHTVPTLVNQWQGLTLYLGCRLPWKSDLNEANLSSAGPTVTNTALSVANDLGFKRVILAGVDLCFTREGYTHAKGSDEHIAGPRFNLTSLQVETNDGFMAPSSCDFAQAISSLGLQAKVLQANGCKIINVSGAAAKVENVEYIRLDDIELDNAQLDVDEVVSARLRQAESPDRFYQKLLEELKRAQFQIKAIAKLAEHARRINDEMYNDQGLIEDYKDKRTLDQIEKKFKREHRQFSRLVKKFGIRSFIKLSKPFTDEEWTAEEAKQLGNVFYDAYQEGTVKLIGLLDDAMQRLTSRMEENVEGPDFAKLIAQTRKDRSFGRVRLWRQKFAGQAIPANILAEFADLQQRFIDVVNDRNTVHFAKAKSYSSLSKLKQRAVLLFKHKKIQELQDLLAGLDKHELQEAAVSYRHLINGYLFELQNQNQMALATYQQIVDQSENLLEEALIRIANISIEQQDSQSAGLSLQCLSQLNPQYLPFYAEIQRLNGNVMACIDAYNQYVKQFPADFLVQIQLVNIYTEIKIYDAAELMLDYILQQKPDYDVAVALKDQLQLQKAG